MTELQDKIVAAHKEYDDKTKDLTDEEIEKKGASISADSAEKQGLPVQKEITLRGKVYEGQNFDKISMITLMPDELKEDEDVDYNKTISCYFEGTKSEFIFLEKNENIVIKGMFCDKGKGMVMTKCEIVSPKQIDVPEFDSNISEILMKHIGDDDYSEHDVLLYGVVESADPITMDEDAIEDEYGDDILLAGAIKRSKHLVTVRDEKNSDAVMIWLTNSNECKVGDKICFSADIRKAEEGYLFYAESIFNDICYIYK